MENASKALLIAAAVLIVIILIAVGMKIYSSTSGAQKVGIDTGKTISDKTGGVTDLATYELTGKKINKSIKYYDGESEKQIEQNKIKQGDIIKIGSERFMIFLIDNEGIKAVPYYNLVTVIATGEVKQGPAVEGTSTEISSSFSTTNYWVKGDDVINLDDSKNNIGKYITAYKVALNKLGVYELKVRAARYSELDGKGVTNIMRNPGNTGAYWTGSADPYRSQGVHRVIEGKWSTNLVMDYYWNSYGVRPIIIIPK